MIINIGVDPGKGGAIAGIRGKEVVFVYDCPLTNKKLDVAKLGGLVRGLAIKYPELHTTIEEVSTFSRDSRRGAFTFGGNFFAWQVAFATMNVDVLLVEPKKWKRVVLGGMLGTDKSVSVATAKLMFPNAKDFGVEKHDRAEAMLLAEFGRRVLHERTLAATHRGVPVHRPR